MNIYFFRTPKPKRFEFKPRYYDPVKEEWEQKKKERGVGVDDREQRLRAEMRSRWRNDSRVSRKKADITKTFFFLLLAALLIYLIFFA